MEPVKITVLKAGTSDVNGNVYTEECLRKAAECHPKLKFEGGNLVAEIPFNEFVGVTRSGGIVDLRRYECGDRCECCGVKDGDFVIDRAERNLVKMELSLCGAATAYHWDGTGENPNRPQTLCQLCAAAYYDHWEEMWAEYRSSQGL